jgi:putative ABC transport system substrate-binding protein
MNVSNETEIESAFANLGRQNIGAVLVGADPFISNQRMLLALLAARFGVPSMHGIRTFPAAGGLISYGAKFTEAYHQAGVYAGRILKGQKPADLPVVQSSRFELVINLKAARVINVTVPATLLAIADEVIE